MTSSARPTAPSQRPHLRVVGPADGATTGDAADEVARHLIEDGAIQHASLGPVDLEMGGHLADVTLAYRTWGRLNAAGDNAVVICHALTGDSLAGGPGGWWEPVIGPGKALDTDERFVVCANVLGGCQGSTGPASIDPATGAPYAMRFPLITIGDIVATQRRLVERLGVTRLVATGGSIGGFQALEWATRHPDLVAGAIPIAASETLGAQGIALHGEIGRRAIMADPNWRGGDYQAAGVVPEQGLTIARMAAMVTYHSRQSLGDRFGRQPATRPTLHPAFGPTFDVEGYLHYHGAALVRRFDANSYLYLTKAMDLYDLGRDGGLDAWLDRIAAPLLLIGISSDWLFPPGDVRALAERIAARGKDAAYVEIDSPNGHDAFLKDWDQMNPLIAGFMERRPAGRNS
ncbi:MAG: homoserine O-acetyltransferase [Actinomycetota bacterium]|nr:homoserine O-acetyltransferase [Actinomycetota bacterium]